MFLPPPSPALNRVKATVEFLWWDGVIGWFPQFLQVCHNYIAEVFVCCVVVRVVTI